MWSPMGMSTSASSGRADSGRGADAAAQVQGSTSLGALQEGHGLHGEGLAEAVEEGVEGGLAAQHAAGQEGEDLGLGAQAGGLVRAPGGQVDHRGDGNRHADEDRDGDDVLRVGDGQRVEGRGEVVVQQQRAERCGGQCGQQPAEQRCRHREGQEEQHVVGQPEVGDDAVQQQREQGRPGDAGEPAPVTRARPSRAPRATGSPRPLAASSWVTRWTSRSGPDSRATVALTPGPKTYCQALAARDAQDDLGGVDSAGEVQQGLRDVVADDVVEGAAEVFDQRALDGEFLGRGGGQAVAAGDVDGQDLAARALLGEARGAADERTALRAAGQADDDPLAGAARWCETLCSLRYSLRYSSTRSATHSSANSRRAVRFPGRK